jgi:hypothetical protein
MYRVFEGAMLERLDGGENIFEIVGVANREALIQW